MRQRVTDETEGDQLSDMTSLTEITLPHPTAMMRTFRLGALINITPIYCS